MLIYSKIAIYSELVRMKTFLRSNIQNCITTSYIKEIAFIVIGTQCFNDIH